MTHCDTAALLGHRRHRRQGQRQQPTELIAQQGRRQRRPHHRLGRQLAPKPPSTPPHPACPSMRRATWSAASRATRSRPRRSAVRARSCRPTAAAGIGSSAASPPAQGHRAAAARCALPAPRPRAYRSCTQQVVVVAAAVGDGAARAVDVLRTAARAVHADRAEGRGFERRVEIGRARAGHVHLEEAFADRPDPGPRRCAGGTASVPALDRDGRRGGGGGVHADLPVIGRGNTPRPTHLPSGYRPSPTPPCAGAGRVPLESNRRRAS